MPRKATTKTQLRYKTVWGNVEKYCAINNIDRCKLATILQLSANTIASRKKSPERLSLGEMLRFCDVVNIDIGELFK